TWVTGPPEVSVVIRICSTPGNVPVRVVTVQRVCWWLSRSRRIWNEEVVAAAEAADARPTVSSRKARAILTLVAIMEFIGDLLDRNDWRPPSPIVGTGGDERSDRRWRTASMAQPTLRLCPQT